MARLPTANIRPTDTRWRSGGAMRGGFPMAMTGTVKFFNGERGYGFIKPDDGGRDVFVHITAVERAGLKDLAEGQRITFEVEPDKKGKGPKAVNLVISPESMSRKSATGFPSGQMPGVCPQITLKQRDEIAIRFRTSRILMSRVYP